ncbi:MAG: hypothetical protein K1X79_06250 [Oligoflexia bacterium]|nr:hypothetical protein [Oligoflexia bacterium]
MKIWLPLLLILWPQFAQAQFHSTGENQNFLIGYADRIFSLRPYAGTSCSEIPVEEFPAIIEVAADLCRSVESIAEDAIDSFSLACHRRGGKPENCSVDLQAFASDYYSDGDQSMHQPDCFVGCRASATCECSYPEATDQAPYSISEQ